jgi:uncharacterized protein YjbJ (UPF0337 family)
MPSPGPPGPTVPIVTGERRPKAQGGDDPVNKDKLKGKMEQIKGDLKERIGGASKDRSTQAEGFAEEKKGKLREGFGDVKERVEDETERQRREPDAGKDI